MKSNKDGKDTPNYSEKLEDSMQVMNDQGEEEDVKPKGYLSGISGYLGGGSKKPKEESKVSSDPPKEAMISRA